MNVHFTFYVPKSLETLSQGCSSRDALFYAFSRFSFCIIWKLL